MVGGDVSRNMPRIRYLRDWYDGLVGRRTGPVLQFLSAWYRWGIARPWALPQTHGSWQWATLVIAFFGDFGILQATDVAALRVAPPIP